MLSPIKKQRGLLRGFTLIELLVVISIISLLSSIVFAGVNSGRGKARFARVRADLAQARTAIALLADDTGKWPHGCPPGWPNSSIEDVDDEYNLSDAKAGLLVAPPVGPVPGIRCAWTAEDIAKWRGPYLNASAFNDPWGTPYAFDADYNCTVANPKAKGCEGSTGVDVAVYSAGPNKSGFNAYDSDDIVLIIAKCTTWLTNCQ